MKVSWKIMMSEKQCMTDSSYKQAFYTENKNKHKENILYMFIS